MKIDPAISNEFRQLKRRRAADVLDTLGIYGTFPDQLRPVMPKDAIWVRDVTQSNTTWGNRVFPLYEPAAERLSGGRRHRAGPVTRHRRGGCGQRAQDDRA